VKSAAPRTGCTVLLVEDDDGIRDSVRECLVFEGYDVAAAANGAEALVWLERGVRPSLVLLDMVMPVMSGPELLSRIRADRALADVPVVLMTAAVQRELLVGARVEAFLAKPFDLAELLKVVERFC
jgi:two-component system, chemotaxis family, chemotaxis protein CheY